MGGSRTRFPDISHPGRPQQHLSSSLPFPSLDPRELFGVTILRPLLPASFFIVVGCTIPIAGAPLSCRNYRQGQLKRMSLNGAAPDARCRSRTMGPTVDPLPRGFRGWRGRTPIDFTTNYQIIELSLELTRGCEINLRARARIAVKFLSFFSFDARKARRAR